MDFIAISNFATAGILLAELMCYVRTSQFADSPRDPSSGSRLRGRDEWRTGLATAIAE